MLHDLLTLEGSGMTELAVSDDFIVAALSVRHRLLTARLMVLSAASGDVIAERNFVDVLAVNLVHDGALVVVNNQVRGYCCSYDTLALLDTHVKMS